VPIKWLLVWNVIGTFVAVAAFTAIVVVRWDGAEYYDDASFPSGLYRDASGMSAIVAALLFLVAIPVFVWLRRKRADPS
jgi:hypothetical protein